MTPQEAEQRLNYLIKVIERHNELYYNRGEPEISDAEYDLLRRELLDLEASCPRLKREKRASERVGAAPSGEFAKVRHIEPMISLQDVFSEGEFKEFFFKAKRLLKLPGRGGIEAWAEPKIDGLSASLIYHRGKFTRGATRGDGFIGEDVTKNLLTIYDIPKELISDQGRGAKRLEVRGEVYMPRDVFKELNRERVERGDILFSNPRNAAAGSLRQKNARITKERRLRFFAYEVICDEIKFDRQDQVSEFLQMNAFISANPARVCRSWEEMQDFYESIQSLRPRLPYDIDGVVFKINNRELQKRLGNLGRVPRHSVAYKFLAEQAQTTVKEIIFQVGRTGVLTPVAILEPVRLGGTTVSRSTLHNCEEIIRLDIRRGDKVVLQRSGDVIPQVIRVMKELRTGPIEELSIPERCPCCNRLVVRDSVSLVCPGGFECADQAIARLSHFVSRQAMDIDGLGESNLRFLYETHRVRSFADIFSLKERNERIRRKREQMWQLREIFSDVQPSSELSTPSGSLPAQVSVSDNGKLLQDKLPLELENGWGPVSVKKLFRAIEARRTVDLGRYIYALGIPQVGRQVAEWLAQTFCNLDTFRSCSVEQLQSVEGIGTTTANEILHYLNDFRAREDMDKLLHQIQVNPYRQTETTSGPLFGKTVVFTGTLEKSSRDEAKKQAIQLGAKVGSTITVHTDFLVVGANAGRKRAEAERLGVRIVDENEWLRMSEGSQR